MTCIAGLVHDDIVHLGADSAASAGWDMSTRADPKLFTLGPYAIGFTDSYRMGQLLRYSFKPPAPKKNLHKFMCTTFVDTLRQCLKDGGWAKTNKDQEESGAFLVGVRGKLFHLGSDYQVGESADPFDAVGCGAQLALGALYATGHLAYSTRLELALAAAERFSNGVRGPFIYVSTE